MSGAKFGYSKYLPLLSGLIDIFLINISFFLSHYFRFHQKDWWPAGHDAEFWFLCNFLYLIIAYYQRAYAFIRVDPLEKVVKKFAAYFFIYVTVIYLCLFSLNLDEIARLWILYFLVTSFLLIIIARICSLLFFKWYRRHGKNYRRIVIVGTDSVSVQLFHNLRKDLTLGYKILGLFDFGKCGADIVSISGANYLGDRSALLKFLHDNEVDEVYWKLGGDIDPHLKSVVEYCENNLIRFRMVPFLGLDVLGRKPHIDMYNLIPVVTLRNEPLQRPSSRMVKRTFDVLFSLIVLLVLAPTVFLLIAVLIKIFSPGPVFFKQLRSGENNREFWCYKFRTMKVNAFSDELQATKHDQRITPLGSFLRKSSLDELPQFWNVLKGEMSVVGPRPHMLKHTAEYRQTVSKFLVRHFAKPGITGWAQINGFRGETKELEDMEKRVEADIWYVENWSLLLDIRIVIVTIFNMFRGEKNAY
jgi:putative colanic acid biosynthesis UDP-glucose lipid carrier transferase